MEDLEEVGGKMPEIWVWEDFGATETGHSKSVKRIGQDGWKIIQTKE